MEPTNFQEAIDWANARQVVLPNVYYGSMQGLSRAAAFSIAGIAKVQQLQLVLESLQNAMIQGTTFNEWKQLLAVQQLGLPEHRLDNIYRTNVINHFSYGRTVQQDANTNRRPYYLYSAVNDSRTRASHAAMHGMVARYDDPVWRAWTPPNGYRCRCKRIALTEAQSKNYIEADKARLNDTRLYAARQLAVKKGPDKHWDYNVGGSPLAGIRDSADNTKKNSDPNLSIMITWENKYETPKKPSPKSHSVTKEEAIEWAEKNGIKADYTDMSVEVMDATNTAVADTQNRFPGLDINVISNASYAVYAKEHAKKRAGGVRKNRSRADDASDKILKTANDSEVGVNPDGDALASVAVSSDAANNPVANIIVTDKPASEVSRAVVADKDAPRAVPLRYIIDQQIGALLAMVLGLTYDQQLINILKTSKKLIAKQLTPRAIKNIESLVAEAWSEYVSSPTPGTIANQIGAIVENAYARRYIADATP